METLLVRRDQFSISPQGIVHQPTDAAFIPNSDDPRSGMERLGHLTSKTPDFDPNSVERMMRQLWDEYVTENPQFFCDAADVTSYTRGQILSRNLVATGSYGGCGQKEKPGC